MSSHINKLASDFQLPEHVKPNNVTKRQRSIPIDIRNSNLTEYYLNLSWSINEGSALIHVGNFKLNLLGLVEEGFARQENPNTIRLIMIREANGDIVLRLNKKEPQIIIGNIKTRSVMIANLSYNIFSWRAPYINPKAAHKYATKYPGHESLNFKFDKKGIDSDKHVYGYFSWQNAPVNFGNGGTVIFYTNNTEENIGQIVGVYGNAFILDEPRAINWKGFENDKASLNIRADKSLSLLFPIPLVAEKYKKFSKDRLVGQVGYSYYDSDVAQRIVIDALRELLNSENIRNDEIIKLKNIYEYITGKPYSSLSVPDKDQSEEEELINYFNSNKEGIVADLNNLEEFDDELVSVNSKKYKRDNKTIAQLKILRRFKCQICSTKILKSNGSFYIEAAHIKPKSKRGRETPDNILILCPNHHKEFDYGNKEIIKHDKFHIEFRLNNEIFNINLRVE